MTDERFAPEDLSHDRFLGGRLTLAQPRRGYRAGIDPVLLAASVPARPDERVLELGSGVGTALFCLAARVSGLSLTGVERAPAYAALARDNAAANGIAARIVTADLAALPAELRQESFDHVLANPPYFDPAASSAASDPGREAGRSEETPLALWIEVAARRLRPGGRLTLIHRAERLPQILAALSDRLGAICVQPLAPREGREARLVLVRAAKGGRAPFRLLDPIRLHKGRAHLRDEDDYAPEIARVLRDGEALSFG
ncbi:tRNA1(Val) (adenine(37)-N6)-methyltransferase [Litorisediminicola beolgyonensis]|uniref:tRNA1(Val) (Adenine(37)-N6)-methyltransferase n=1 Tax=Litorisediminicola beolgyonensis TaxID=1173614 RepID=A0ABW3ZGZ0_9RHOB